MIRIPLRLTLHLGWEPIRCTFRKHVPCEASQRVLRVLAARALVQAFYNFLDWSLCSGYLFPSVHLLAYSYVNPFARSLRTYRPRKASFLERFHTVHGHVLCSFLHHISMI